MRSVKESYSTNYKYLDLIAYGFSTLDIVSHYGNMLTVEGFLENIIVEGSRSSGCDAV
jgi:hypothetical protein